MPTILSYLKHFALPPENKNPRSQQRGRSLDSLRRRELLSSPKLMIALEHVCAESTLPLLSLPVSRCRNGDWNGFI